MSIVEPGGSADVPEIDDGLYQATVKAVKDIVLDQADQFGNTEKVEIHLSFADADGVVHTLEPRPNRKWGEKSTLFAIATACGLDVEPYEAFDTEALVGCKVNILVETPEEGKWPRVKSWTRVRAKAATAAPPAAAGRITGPAWVDANGDIAWPQYYKALEMLGGTREGLAAKVGGLDKLAEFSVTQLADILEEIRS